MKDHIEKPPLDRSANQSPTWEAAWATEEIKVKEDTPTELEKQPNKGGVSARSSARKAAAAEPQEKRARKSKESLSRNEKKKLREKKNRLVRQLKETYEDEEMTGLNEENAL